MKLTKAQIERLERVANGHAIRSASDLDGYETLATLGLVTVREPKPGYFSASITDAGRAALATTKGEKE